MNIICNLMFLKFPFLVLDLEEELFKAKERMIEISIEKDHLFDANFDLEKQVHYWQVKFRKLQKQYSLLKKVHDDCPKRNVILYR